jgi:hypothetical protein
LITNPTRLPTALPGNNDNDKEEEEEEEEEEEKLSIFIP